MSTRPPSEHQAEDAQTWLPLLPLRDVVVYPHMVIPLFVGRPKSVHALEKAMNTNKWILLAAQKEASEDNPTPADIYTYGTRSMILQLLKLADGTIKVLVEGQQRIRLLEKREKDGFFQARMEPVESPPDADLEPAALTRSLLELFEQYVKLHRKTPPEVVGTLSGLDDPSRIADTVAAHLQIKIESKAEGAGDHTGQGAARADHRAVEVRDRRVANRPQDPRPRQVADGKKPARVLPE